METCRKSRSSMFLFGTRATKLVAIIALMTLGMTEAPAGMIMFTHEGNGNGTLAGNLFPVSHFVITAVGDTGDRLSCPGGWFIDHSWAAISIDGVGDFEFLTGTRTFVSNNSQTVGFSRAGIWGADLFNGPTALQFATWDMLDPIGPISGLGRLLQWTSTPLIDTTGGILKFDSSTSNATFTAVPEPGTVLLVGLGSLALLRKRGA